MPRGEEPCVRAQQAASDPLSFWFNESNQVRIGTEQQGLWKAGQLRTEELLGLVFGGALFLVGTWVTGGWDEAACWYSGEHVVGILKPVVGHVFDVLRDQHSALARRRSSNAHSLVLLHSMQTDGHGRRRYSSCRYWYQHCMMSDVRNFWTDESLSDQQKC